LLAPSDPLCLIWVGPPSCGLDETPACRCVLCLGVWMRACACGLTLLRSLSLAFSHYYPSASPFALPINHTDTTHTINGSSADFSRFARLSIFIIVFDITRSLVHTRTITLFSRLAFSTCSSSLDRSFDVRPLSSSLRSGVRACKIYRLAIVGLIQHIASRITNDSAQPLFSRVLGFCCHEGFGY
jgi:hypothetical protein